VSVELRPYQIEITAEFEKMVAQGERRILLVAPTAAGKTVIASAIIWPAAGRATSTSPHERK